LFPFFLFLYLFSLFFIFHLISFPSKFRFSLFRVKIRALSKLKGAAIT